jgi:hypothetical protein
MPPKTYGSQRTAVERSRAGKSGSTSTMSGKKMSSLSSVRFLILSEIRQQLMVSYNLLSSLVCLRTSNLPLLLLALALAQARKPRGQA